MSNFQRQVLRNKIEAAMRTRLHRWVRNVLVLPWLVVGIGIPALAQNSEQQPALPDSPGAVTTQKVVQIQQFPEQPTFLAQSSQQSQSQSQSESQSNGIREPQGTAIAEKPATTGVAASNAAGAAIAPAKQRRVRTIIIKFAAIAGAGVAVGTVAALSSASPSRPPGSH